MPLVMPEMFEQGKDKTSDWSSKLMGKKLGDTSNEVTFAKKDLPSEHRVIGPDTMSTADHKPDRLNVHVGEDGTVNKVTHG